MKKLFSLLILLSLCILAFGCKESKKINFVAEGCDEINNVSIKDLSEFKLPENPQKEGYKFIGWYLDKDYTKEFKSLDNIEDSEITLYAKFEKEEKYTVTFMDDDKVIEKLTVTKDESVKCKELTKDKHLFLGWYDGETKFENGSVVTKDTTLKAKWVYNYVNFSVNENKHILNKEYASKYAKDGVITIDNNINAIYYDDLDKIYFNGTEEEFRNIYIYANSNDNLEFYINNELINFEIADKENKEAINKVNIKVVSFYDNERLEDFQVTVEKNSKLTGEFAYSILTNNKLFHEWNDLGESFIKLYEDEAKEKEFDKNYFNNADKDVVIYAYFEPSKDFIKSISGKYQTLNGDEVEINGYDLTIFGTTFTLKPCYLGPGVDAFVTNYEYMDEVISIYLYLGNNFIDECIGIGVVYDFNSISYGANYYLVK